MVSAISPVYLNKKSIISNPKPPGEIYPFDQKTKEDVIKMIDGIADVLKVIINNTQIHVPTMCENGAANMIKSGGF